MFIDFTWRLAGVRRIGDRLEWNVRPPAPGVTSEFTLRVNPVTTATLRYAGSEAELQLNGRTVARPERAGRVLTSLDGRELPGPATG